MRDIVVHSADFRCWRGSVRFAAQLAASTRAALTGLYVTPIRPPAPGPPLLVEEMAAYAQDELHQAMLAGPDFAAWASRLGVEETRWQVAIGPPADALVLAGDWHDLVVLQGNAPAKSISERLVCEILLSDAPCIVVPEANVAPGRVRQAVIAWNDSAASTRALHAALPLLRGAESVALLHPPPSDLRRRSVSQALAHLRAQGVPVAAVETVGEVDGDASEALLTYAEDHRAELLVMGASGYRRLGEQCFGPTTNGVLAHARLPAFLKH